MNRRTSRQISIILAGMTLVIVSLLIIGALASSGGLVKGHEPDRFASDATQSGEKGPSSEVSFAGSLSDIDASKGHGSRKGDGTGESQGHGSGKSGSKTISEAAGYPDVINVVKYGADPTGRTDCTKLLSDLHKTGKKIYYPNGTYLFNGLRLDFSGGVEFESKDGVIIRNSISDTQIVNFDEKGNLIGLMHNHLESVNEDFTGVSGNLVPPPLSKANLNTKVDFIPYWYNDFGLQCIKQAQTGWIGWYYWTWNHHNSDELGFGPYDPTRHPLLGFYRGDDPVVLDWQCYWLLEYGATGVSLLNFTSLTGWENPRHRDHWIYQLFHNTPNFKKLKYIMHGDYSYHAGYDRSYQKFVEDKFFELVDKIYSKYDNYYYVEKNGKKYPVISVLEELQYRVIFNGDSNVKNFYRRLAERFQSYGFGGFALYARMPLPLGNMEKDGVLRYETSYTPNYTITDYTGRYTYRDLVERFNPPVNSSVVISVATALHTKPPHQSNWKLPGNTPELFSTYLKKAISHLKAHPEMPQVLMCYNVSEWSEGGPGLVPTVGDGFGYLRAIYDNNVEK